MHHMHQSTIEEIGVEESTVESMHKPTDIRQLDARFHNR